MTLCTFDVHGCDLFCCADDGRYTTNVAARKDDGNGLVPIGGPWAGWMFTDWTAQQFYRRLLMLRRAGYRFPDSVLSAAVREALQ